MFHNYDITVPDHAMMGTYVGNPEILR